MVTATIDGANRLRDKLRKLLERFGVKDKEEVVVGFSQRYALYVHEIQAYHKVGQWKYLETPARSMRAQLGEIISSGLKKGLKLQQCQMMAGLALQRAAQELTPVDTSALKASAFTCPLKDVEAVSQAAFSKSESIRLGQRKK
jgi:hypothetical protein